MMVLVLVEIVDVLWVDVLLADVLNLDDDDWGKKTSERNLMPSCACLVCPADGPDAWNCGRGSLGPLAGDQPFLQFHFHPISSPNLRLPTTEPANHSIPSITRALTVL